MAEPLEIHQAPKAVRDDGAVPFLRPQEGVAPTAANHLATKQYVDDEVAGGGGGGGGAPTSAPYLVGAADAGLSAERVVTDTATVAWDLSTSGQAKANVPDESISNAKLIDNTIAHARLVNVSGPGLLGSLTGGAVSTIAGTTPPREEPSLADNLIYFQSSVDGAIKRCTVEDLLNVIAAHFGL
jgi:hypothetical protein